MDKVHFVRAKITHGCKEFFAMAVHGLWRAHATFISIGMHVKQVWMYIQGICMRDHCPGMARQMCRILALIVRILAVSDCIVYRARPSPARVQ